MQREDERESGTSADVDDLLDADLSSGDRGDDLAGGDRRDDGRTSSTSAGSESRIGLDGRYFSLKALGIAAGVLFAGGFLGGLLPIVGTTLGPAAGLLVAAFLLGLLFSERRYVETGLAGGGTGLASALTGVFTAGIFGIHFLQEYGFSLAVGGGALGLVLALIGHYFGRDLRAGLYREIE